MNDLSEIMVYKSGADSLQKATFKNNISFFLLEFNPLVSAGNLLLRKYVKSLRPLDTDGSWSYQCVIIEPCRCVNYIKSMQVHITN